MSDAGSAQQSSSDYLDVTRAPTGLRVIGWLVLVAAAGFVVLGIFYRHSIFSDATGVVGFVGGLAVLIFVGVVFSRLTLTLAVAHGYLTLSVAPIVRKRIPIAGITDVAVGLVETVAFGGVGYRISGHDRALLFSSGPAVIIRDGSTGRQYFYRSNQAAGLRDTINSLLNAPHTPE